MIGEYFVVDAVTHAFDAREVNTKGRYGRLVLESIYQNQWKMASDPYRLSRGRFFQRMSAEALASAMFVESATDIACFHPIPAWGMFEDLSPASVALEIRSSFPHRMLLYGAVSPLEGAKAIDDLVRQKEEWKIDGLKLYPVDIIDGKSTTLRLNSERVMYPVLEKCRELGIFTIAVHKSLPVGTAPMDAFRPDDVEYAADDFPDLNFEIVHGGYTFLEETAFQLARFDNIYVNLESTIAMIVRRPHQFARILGELLLWGGPERIFWGTGATPHPAPLIEAFAAFEMPEELQEGYGYPPLTEETKTDIFSRNYARVHEIDLDERRAACSDDELARRRRAGGATPWGLVEEPSVADPLALESA